jgi:hypothetical protein
MDIERKMPNVLITMFAGLLAIASGLLSIASRPLLAVLAILGGMALAICSGVEMAVRFSEPGSPPEESK